MKKTVILFLVFYLLFAFSSFAKKVSVEEAELVARNHYFQRNSDIKNYETLIVKLAYNPTSNSDFAFYVFDLGNNDGYVVVSPDDAIAPVLAYATSGCFNANNIAPQQKGVYDYYSACIAYVQKNEVVPNEDVAPRWERMLNYSNGNDSKDINYSSPVLMETITWDQLYPYNEMCPIKDGSRTPTGCVATAIGQVMKYWNWPETGTGSITHGSNANGGFGNIQVNFAQQTYDWGAIPDVGTISNDELAKLLYHVGVACRMRWESDGSGSTANEAQVLKTYFKYASTASQKSRNSYGESSWKSMIRTEIDAGRPIVYSGYSSSWAGHAWVCDGYQTRTEGDFFHMNWGWGPYGGNNYCTLDNLVSSATGGGEEMNFTVGNTMSIGIKPNSEFTYGCRNFVTHGFEGSFDDGSYGNNYDNNLNCSYIIEPSCGTNITIKFPKFDLGTGDEVRIYSDINGTNLVETYTQNSTPSYNGVTINSDAALIKFLTNASNNDKGWRASYSVKTCSSTPIYYTETSGIVEDGSKDCLYNKSQNCKWIIAPTQGNRISFTFNDFSFYSSVSDRLRIYKSATGSSADLLYTFTNNNQPSNTTYTVESDTIMIWFNSGSSSLGGEGFSLTYNATTVTDIETYQSNSEIKVFPNPSTYEDLQFEIANIEEKEINVTILNMLGQQIATKEIALNDKTIFNLSEITSQKLENGIYYLNVATKTKNNIVKFSIIK